MIEPSSWTPFSNDEEAMTFLKNTGLLSPKAASIKSFVYTGVFSDGPRICEIAGYAAPFTAVIRFGDKLHAINTDHLSEMQSGMSKWLREAETLTRLKSFVALDVETTGLSAGRDSIIEIGAVKYENGVEIDSFSMLINPGFAIPAHITKLTGITTEDVADAPAINEAVPQLSEFLCGHPLVMHNAPFDCAFISAAYSLCDECFDYAVYDTLTLSRKQFRSLPNHKLQTLISHFGIDGGAAHRATSDARATAELFNICVNSMR